MTCILVTGGAGYIGAHTCKALAAAGYEPVVYDNLCTGHEWAVKWGALEKGDILDGERLVEVMRRYRPEAVIHFAAFAYVGESVREPAKYYRNNVSGTLSILDAMRAARVNKLVFSSTCATYGIPDTIPILENAPQVPINPYGASKLMVERILDDYGKAYGIRSVSLRYFNAAGADPDGEVGEVHEPETHLIPLVLDAAMGRREVIEIFGTDYDTPDGTCIRDYIHVTDLADAHVRALSADVGEGGMIAYNLGTGRGHSVREVIRAVERVTGLKVPVGEGERRPGDPPVLVSAPGRANRELGWTPRYSDLDTMIATAWKWHQSWYGRDQR